MEDPVESQEKQVSKKMHKDQGLDKMRAVSYPRVSKGEQEKEGYSFEAQDVYLKRRIQEAGRVHVGVYKGEGDATQDRSASIKAGMVKIKIDPDKFSMHAFIDLGNRPNFVRMMHDAKLGLFDEVWFYKWDRFSRYFPVTIFALDWFRQCGVRCIPVEDTNDSIAKGFVQLLAQQESEKTSQRVKVVTKIKFQSGLPVGVRTPPGYRYISKKKASERGINPGMVIDTKEAAIVRSMFSDVASGMHYKKVCEKYQISPSTLYNRIRNVTYLGLIKHHEMVDIGNHKAIIKAETWFKANEQLGG